MTVIKQCYIWFILFTKLEGILNPLSDSHDLLSVELLDTEPLITMTTAQLCKPSGETCQMSKKKYGRDSKSKEKKYENWHAGLGLGRRQKPEIFQRLVYLMKVCSNFLKRSY